MGTDIEMYAEKKVNGKWMFAGREVVNKYYLDGHDQIMVPEQINLNRSYDLFAVLAHVRLTIANPISEPKGIPGDLSPEVKRMWDWDDGDAYPASWLNLDEILGYDWECEEDSRLGKLTHRELASQFYYEVIPYLRSLRAEEGVEDVRVVFWFNS